MTVEASILDPVQHERLIAEAGLICARANIPVHYLHRSSKPMLTHIELEWLRHWKTSNENLMLTGVHKPGPDMKLMAMAAVLIRNYVDARVMSINTALDGDEPEATVLLIPNLYILGPMKSMPGWRIQKMYDLLLNRMQKNQKTVVYVESLSGLGNEYGTLFSGHLDSYVCSKGVA